MRMRLILLPSWACLAVPILHTLSRERRDFREEKKITEHKICGLIISTNLSETFPILRRIQLDITTNVDQSSCIISAILIGF